MYSAQELPPGLAFYLQHFLRCRGTAGVLVVVVAAVLAAKSLWGGGEGGGSGGYRIASPG